MKHPLYFTPAEQTLFAQLPASLQEGWEIAEERPLPVESPRQREVRLMLARIHDPKLLALRDKAMKATSAQEVAALLEDTTLEGVANDDLAQLFFALGPTALSSLLENQIRSATTDDDLSFVEGLTVIRHAMLPA